jgi:hypothetical protein
MTSDNAVEPAVVIEDDDRWARVPEALAYDHEIGDHTVRVFICLYRHGDDPSHCFPSDERIAECIGGSDRSVARCRMQLQEKGWIRRFPRTTANGMRATNGYALALDPARARRNAAAFARGDEPEALRRGRLAAAERPAAQECADATSAHHSAARPRTTARPVRAPQRGEREPVKESQRKRNPPTPRAEKRADQQTLHGQSGQGGSDVSSSSRRPPARPPRRDAARPSARPAGRKDAAPASNDGQPDPVTLEARRIAEHVSATRRPAPLANVRQQTVVYADCLKAGWTATEVQTIAMAAATITPAAMEVERRRHADARQPRRSNGNGRVHGAAYDERFLEVFGDLMDAPPDIEPRQALPRGGAIIIKETTSS